MHIVVAPDKFKGTLTARQVADRIAAGIRVEAPDVAVVRVPVADGGNGTVDAAVAAGFTRVAVRAEGSTGAPADTAFAVRDGVAVVEMADVSGLRLLPPDELAARDASSYGTGEVVRAAIEQGSHRRARYRWQRKHRRRRRDGAGTRRLGHRCSRAGTATGRRLPGARLRC